MRADSMDKGMAVAPSRKHDFRDLGTAERNFATTFLRRLLIGLLLCINKSDKFALARHCALINYESHTCPRQRKVHTESTSAHTHRASLAPR